MLQGLNLATTRGSTASIDLLPENPQTSIDVFKTKWLTNTVSLGSRKGSILFLCILDWDCLSWQNIRFNGKKDQKYSSLKRQGPQF